MSVIAAPHCRIPSVRQVRQSPLTRLIQLAPAILTVLGASGGRAAIRAFRRAIHSLCRIGITGTLIRVIGRAAAGCISQHTADDDRFQNSSSGRRRRCRPSDRSGRRRRYRSRRRRRYWSRRRRRYRSRSRLRCRFRSRSGRRLRGRSGRRFRGRSRASAWLRRSCWGSRRTGSR